jgi:cell division protein FtsI/penicillin-binding protein 2
LAILVLALSVNAQEKVIARAGAEPPKPAPKTVIAKAQAQPAKASTPKPAAPKPAVSKPAAKTAKKPAPARKPVRKVVRKPVPPRFPTYGHPAEGDDPVRDDPEVRTAAMEALGNLMGSVVVVDPDNGRILAVVNQKLAFHEGYQPCSSFKPAVALAALGEGIIESDKTSLQLGKRWYLTLEKALALSNNLYFEKLGRLLGIDKLEHYARQFGFGEPAAWGLSPNPEGAFPTTAPSARLGGVGKVASFGQGISMTMLQLASFTSALANGGTLYYLQYLTPEEQAYFEPKIKRELNLGSSLAVVREGMEEAVLTGTARRAKQPDVHVMGKTGTCSENRARLGWFAGYNNEPGGVAVVVLLRTGVKLGGGARASEVAGRVFRKLDEREYYARASQRLPQTALPASAQMPGLP